MNERNANHLNLYRQYADVVPFRRIKKLYYEMGIKEFKKAEPALIYQLGTLRDQKKFSYKWKMFWKRIFDWIKRLGAPKVNVRNEGIL